jgi:hypothetical protein
MATTFEAESPVGDGRAVRSKISLACDTCRRRKYIASQKCDLSQVPELRSVGNLTSLSLVGPDATAGDRLAHIAPMPSWTVFTGRRRALQKSKPIRSFRSFEMIAATRLSFCKSCKWKLWQDLSQHHTTQSEKRARLNGIGIAQLTSTAATLL